MNCQTIIIYLIGRPGIGKYTIAKALSQYGFVVCDNQLINRQIFELLNCNGITPVPQFAWDHIRQLRSIIFNFLKLEKTQNYILTNNLYDTGKDNKLYQQVLQIAANRNSLFIPVKLLISAEQHLQRITTVEKKTRWKSVDPREVYDPTPSLQIKHENLLILDVNSLLPTQAAQQILDHVKKVK